MNTKIIITLLAVTALTLAAVGITAAQIAQNQNQPYTDANPNSAVPTEGFWGWIGNCFGYRANQAYESQCVAPPVGSNVPAPNYQGSYGNGYGYGPCWTR